MPTALRKSAARTPLAVIPAKAGLRRQDAEANIRRKANGPKGSPQERAVTHFDFRARAKWIPTFAGMTERGGVARDDAVIFRAPPRITRAC
jgi:hypothetical protein